MAVEPTELRAKDLTFPPMKATRDRINEVCAHWVQALDGEILPALQGRLRFQHSGDWDADWMWEEDDFAPGYFGDGPSEPNSLVGRIRHKGRWWQVQQEIGTDPGDVYTRWIRCTPVEDGATAEERDAAAETVMTWFSDSDGARRLRASLLGSVTMSDDETPDDGGAVLAALLELVPLVLEEPAASVAARLAATFPGKPQDLVTTARAIAENATD